MDKNASVGPLSRAMVILVEERSDGPELYLERAKFAYVRLNIPTPCPPRSAVLVNRPFSPGREDAKGRVGHESSERCD